MTNFVLIRVNPSPSADRGILESRTFWLESMDGEVVIPIAGVDHAGEWALQAGMTGAGVPPTWLDLGALPGAAGGAVAGTGTLAREMLLPLHLHTQTQAEQFAALDRLRDLTNPERDMSGEGNFRLVCSSSSGVRQLTLAYRSGLEGDTSTLLPWFVNAVLEVVAPQPFAEDRDETTLEFRLGEEFEAFLSASTGTDLPWGTRTLAPTTVIGDGMQVEMTSAVPFYATVEIEGPSGPVSIEADTGLKIDVPLGVDEGDMFRIVTDPRSPSARYNGALAAGRIALGSRRAPLLPGLNVIDVTAPDADENTRLRLSWRGRHRSLW